MSVVEENKQCQEYCHLKGDNFQSGGSVGYADFLLKLSQPSSQFVSDHHIVACHMIAVFTITDVRAGHFTHRNS